MPELETLLRDVRPEPDPVWAARLDKRVAEGFPAPPPRWKRALVALRAHFLLVGAATAVPLLIVLVVVSGGGNDSTWSGGGGSGAPPISDAAGIYEENAAPTTRADEDLARESAPVAPDSPSSAAGGGAVSDAGEQAVAPPESTRPRAVLTSTELELSTTPDKVQGISDRALRIVDSLGGYVESSSVTSINRSAHASLMLKIPSGKLDTAIAQLSRLAHVKSRSQQARDVTDQRAALEAAVRDARADREGLRVRLAKAATDAERSRLRAQLDRAARRVTRAERRVAALARDVSYATVSLEIDGQPKAQPVAPTGRWTPGDAVKDALRVLEVSAGVAVIVLAALIGPALLVLLALLANRAIVHRRREQALET